MTRMTREFSLVLLGASALTAGYFLWSEQDFEKRAEEQARHRVGGSSHVHGPLVWIHSGGYRSGYTAGARPAAVAGISRGGFGHIGARMGGGG